MNQNRNFLLLLLLRESSFLVKLRGGGIFPWRRSRAELKKSRKLE